MEKHVIAVGVLFIGFGIQGVFISLVVLLATLAGVSFMPDKTATSITLGIGLMIVVPILLTESLKIVGGIALLKRRPWARILILILSFFSLLGIPIGTAYGMYAIWVLLKEDTGRLLSTTSDKH